MNKYIELANIQSDFELSAIVLDFEDRLIADWCACVALLEKHLVASIVVHLPDRTFKVQIEMDSSGPSGRGRATWRGNAVTVFATPVQIDYWLHWFLRYYRDEISDVDHIHSEFDLSDSNGAVLDLAFYVSRAVPPVSVDEARKRLGL